MELALLGWPDEAPALRLDWRRFAYAGKFVMTNTGKAVVRDPDAGRSVPEGDRAFATDVLAAVAFNEDRTDPARLWLRYVTVRADRRGEGLGPRLCAFVADCADRRDYDRVRIAVNNPFAYEALYRAGFAFTGEETGIAELVLERPADRPAGRDVDRYRGGLDRYRERDLGEDETAFLRRKEGASPPTFVGKR